MFTSRDKALGVKTNVTNLHAGLDSADKALSDLEKKLQESMDSTENLNKTLTQVGHTHILFSNT